LRRTLKVPFSSTLTYIIPAITAPSSPYHFTRLVPFRIRVVFPPLEVSPLYESPSYMQAQTTSFFLGFSRIMDSCSVSAGGYSAAPTSIRNPCNRFFSLNSFLRNGETLHTRSFKLLSPPVKLLAASCSFCHIMCGVNSLAPLLLTARFADHEK